MLVESEIQYLADKVHVHRWPQDSLPWDDSTKRNLDDLINKNPHKKKILVSEESVQIEDYTFNSLKKIGISVPFFKDECTMILEANFGELSAHVHITTRSSDFLDTFNRLILWRKNLKN